MIAKKTGILLVAGFFIGVIAFLGMLMLTQTGPFGDCAAVLPPVSISQTGLGSEMGNIPEFSSEEQAQKFLISHTDSGGGFPGTSTVTPAPETTGAFTAPDRSRTWSFNIDTSTFKPDEYIISASAVRHPATGTALFNVLERSSRPLPRLAGPGYSPESVSGYYVTIDPVGDHYIGDRFTITGLTNIPADDEVLVQVYTSSFKPTQKSQSGEFSGATGTVKVSDAPRAIAPVATSGPPGVPTSAEERKHSGTNTQVKEFNEADIVKTNGTYIYTVTGNTLRILNAYPADHAKIVATVKFSGSPRPLYLRNDRLVVISEESETREFWKCEKIHCTDASWSQPKTLIFTYGISDPAHPVLLLQIAIDGSLSDSRMIGPDLYFVTTSSAGTSSDGSSFPQILDNARGTQTPNVYYFDRSDKEFTYSMVGSVDVDAKAPVKARTFLIGSAGTIYVSPSHMYIGIATPADDSGAMQTDIYAFTLNNGRIAYAAQGTVNGVLLNQYSLDESEGKLRLPGFAGYLHPYDEYYMISIGRESNNGGVRLALFNVTNVSAPSITDTIELGGRGSDSEVLRDPKAFLFDKEMNLLVLPVTLYGQSGTVAYQKYQPPEDAGIWGGAYVFSMTPSQGFHMKGAVEHYDAKSGSSSPVKRSLYIEDTLYTLSSDMIVMSDLKNGLALINSLAL